MSFEEMGQVVELAGNLVSAGRPLAVVHREVVARASSMAPAACWTAIAEIDTRADVDATSAWLAAALDSSDPPADLSGLWFGLYEIEPAQGTGVEAAIDVAGGPGFPDDDDWLFNLTWNAGYAPARGLGRLLPLSVAETEDVRWLVSYAVVLSYAMALSADVVDQLGAGALLGGRPSLGIVTGFHDGDITMVGTAGATAFTRSGVSWI
jgi:hypothetical protein